MNKEILKKEFFNGDCVEIKQIIRYYITSKNIVDRHLMFFYEDNKIDKQGQVDNILAQMFITSQDNFLIDDILQKNKFNKKGLHDILKDKKSIVFREFFSIWFHISLRQLSGLLYFNGVVSDINLVKTKHNIVFNLEEYQLDEKTQITSNYDDKIKLNKTNNKHIFNTINKKLPLKYRQYYLKIIKEEKKNDTRKNTYNS